MNFRSKQICSLALATFAFMVLANWSTPVWGQVPARRTSYPYPASTPPTAPPNQPRPATPYVMTQTPLIGFQPQTVNGGAATPSYFTAQTQTYGQAPPVVQSPTLQSPYQQPPYPPGSFVPPQLAPSQGITPPPFVGMPPNAIPADIIITVPQNPSGRFMVGANYSSDNNLVGEFIIDERNFDIMRWPRSISDAFSPTAWRGAGQTFRLEAVPGNDLERYLISFSDPFFAGSETSFSVSGYYYNRQFTDWKEQRSGGRIGIGRKLTNYLSLNAGLRMEGVTISEPRVDTSSDLNAVLGYSNLFLGSVGFVYDTRFSPFMADEGTYLAMSYIQAFDDYSYARGEVDFRHHRLLYQRTPTSGSHTLNLRTKLGFSGSSTPIFETYIAGGATSMRGFEFRGISPLQGGVRVGGDFEWLNTIEYRFPLSCYDDHYHGVMFIDYGTVEESVKFSSENFRVAPGVGLRIDLPWAGIGAPLAFDWAFPVSTATGDLENNFSFFIGLMR